MEELQETLNEKGLTISTLPEKGRCLFTARDFSPGEVILTENPYVSVPNKNKESPLSKCEWCFSSTNLKKCSACHVVWYCSSKCQKSDWKLHLAECGVLSKVDKQRVKSLTPSLRLMVKLCMRRKLEIEKEESKSWSWRWLCFEYEVVSSLLYGLSHNILFVLIYFQIIPTSATESYKYVEALVSHMSYIDENQLLLYAQMANLVNLILQWPDSQINVKEIAENFSKLACNAHSICDGELRPLGTGLYPVISIINHSCLPNSVLVFEGRLAVVRAMQHIPNGTEVSISYVDIAGSTITRQKALKEQYYFSCACSRCIKLGEFDDIRESAILEGYKCKDSKCDGFLLHDSDNRGFICQYCGLFRDKEEITNITKEVKTISEKASMSLSSGYNTEAIEAYKMIEGLQLQLYHPLSISLMRSRETLIKIYMELQDWREALSYCRLTIPAYERVYPRFHPLIGLQYYMCGKFEWLLGETEEAIRSLTKALDILRVTHGVKSPFMMELMSKVEEARAELASLAL